MMNGKWAKLGAPSTASLVEEILKQAEAVLDAPVHAQSHSNKFARALQRH